MPDAQIKNLTILGHSGVGKTTFAEAFAVHTGAATRQGTVEEGTTLCDYEPEEKDRHHSLQGAVLGLESGGSVINLVDCPGYPDFISDARASLMAAETAMITVAAPTGVSFHTRVLEEMAREWGLARAIVVTKTDQDNVSFEETLAEVVDAFGDRCVPVVLPNADGDAFSAVVSVLDPPEDLTGDLAAALEQHRSNLVERVVEADDELMEAYLEDGEVSPESVRETLPKAMAQGSLMPVFVVQAATALGVDAIADAAAGWFPGPGDGQPADGSTAAGDPVEVPATVDGPLAAHVWKTVTDDYLGRVCYVRVVRGTLKSDAAVAVAGTDRHGKATGLSRILGRELKPVASAGPGEVVALTKVEAFEYGDTLVDAADPEPVTMSSVFQPSPMTSLAVTPKTHGDEQKIGEALPRLASEDPTLCLRREAATHEMIVDGMSDLHLQVVLARLKRRYGVEVETALPRIPYKETIAASSDAMYRHKKQTGGRGQFGQVHLRVKAVPRGTGFEFKNAVVGGVIPKGLIAAVEKGIRETLVSGVIAGHEVVDVAVEVYDGKTHPVDSDEASFKIAGSRAFKEGMMQAKPVLLEPVMNLAIKVPTRFMGDITGDLNGRRGRIMGMESKDDVQTISAQVPLSEVQQYSTQLRSITAGEGDFAMSFDRYMQMPSHLQEQVVAAAAHTDDSDE